MMQTPDLKAPRFKLLKHQLAKTYQHWPAAMRHEMLIGIAQLEEQIKRRHGHTEDEVDDFETI